jgi:tetratricopeptide (TPR) repeat protein
MRRALQSAAPFLQADAAKRFLAVNAVYTQPSGAAQAAVQVQEILKTDPAYVPALLAAAVLHERQGNVTAARPIYEKLVAQNPLFAPANKHLAILYAGHFGEYQKAYELGMKARELYRDDADLAKALGVAAFQRADYPRAVQLLKESARKRTTDADLYYYLGMAHYRLKDAKESKEALNTALALNANAKLAPEAKRILAELK